MSYSQWSEQFIRNQVQTNLLLLGDFIIIQVKKILFLTNTKCSVSYIITLFGSKIPQSDNIVYAGCLLHANMKSDEITKRVCKTARSKIHSLNSIGVNNSDIHPAVFSKICKRIVLPIALYSCEIWPSLTLIDMQLLEYVQRHFSRIYYSRIF